MLIFSIFVAWGFGGRGFCRMLVHMQRTFIFGPEKKSSCTYSLRTESVRTFHVEVEVCEERRRLGSTRSREASRVVPERLRARASVQPSRVWVRVADVIIMCLELATSKMRWYAQICAGGLRWLRARCIALAT